jgi:hypothetical protein
LPFSCIVVMRSAEVRQLPVATSIRSLQAPMHSPNQSDSSGSGIASLARFSLALIVIPPLMTREVAPPQCLLRCTGFTPPWVGQLRPEKCSWTYPLSRQSCA